MSVLTYMFSMIVTAWVLIYTVSFGIWNWKKKNKAGAVMVMILALISAALPIYILFIKGS